MKQNFFKKITILAAAIFAVNFIFSVAAPALADSNTDILWGGQAQKQSIIDNSGLPADSNINDPRRLIAEFIRLILSFLGILAMIIILYAGFKWMTAGGNEDKVSDAKKILIAGLIGLVIIILAYAIANFVINQIAGAATGWR